MGPILFDKDLSYKDNLYAYLLLCVSGNPFLPEVFTEWIYIVVAFILFILNFNRLLNDKADGNRFLKWIIGFAVLFAAQFVVLSSVSIPADVNFLAKFSISFIIPCILGLKFRYAYFRAISFTAAVSLIFYSIYCLTGWYTGLSFGRDNSILIYNQLIGDDIPRNSGMFWEPGAFQGYINLVPLLFIDNLKQLWEQERFSCVILTLALLTTFSTTGYIVFMVIILSKIILGIHNKFSKFAISIILIFVVIYVFTSLDFLGEKIQEQYQSALIVEQGDASWSRFGAAVVDYYEIARHPFIGNGFLMEARYPTLVELMSGSGNGFTGAINMFGLIIIIIYLMQLYKYSPGQKKVDKCIFIIAIVLLLQGEFFLNFPAFWALLFIKYPQVWYPVINNSFKA